MCYSETILSILRHGRHLPDVPVHADFTKILNRIIA